jgi:hypothetical protein
VSTSTENAPVYRKNTRKLTIKLFASYLYLESGMSAILLVVPSNITNKFQKFHLSKANCAKQFSEGGCILCLKFFNSSQEINNHLYQHAKCGKPLVDATGTNKTSPIYVTR